MTALEEIGVLADIPVDVSVELDRKRMTIREVLSLEPGSIVKLNRSAGDNLDILVGGSMVGSGEIVIIENAVGVRFTDFHGEE